MSESRNPFGVEAGEKRRRRGAGVGGWMVALLLAAALAVVLSIWKSGTETILGLESLHERVLAEAEARQSKAREQIEWAKAELGLLQSRLQDVEKEKQATRDAAKRLEDEMRADLESKDVTISKLQGKLTVSIVDRVMFDSGEAVLKPDGEAVLRKVASLLADHPELKIHVIGHTDNVPIRNRFSSNWELSTARALAAVHFLTEEAGVAPDRLGALGYGEHRPIADNATPEGRAKNRRIAITILHDELAGSDAVSTIQTNAPVVPTTVSTDAVDVPEGSKIPEVPAVPEANSATNSLPGETL